MNTLSKIESNTTSLVKEMKIRSTERDRSQKVNKKRQIDQIETCQTLSKRGK